MANAAKATSSFSQLREEYVKRLEAELRLAKDRLRSTAKELEVTKAKLKSSAEDHQILNDAFETSQEELLDELRNANSDLKNRIESTQIATVFLDTRFRIKSFTPAMNEIFPVIESDMGRPLTDLASSITYPDLQADMHRVLRDLEASERESEDPQTGYRYLVRILPYRGIDNFIAGLVVTFFDISATARAAAALRVSEVSFRRLTDVVPVFLFSADANLNWDYVNPRFGDYTGLAGPAALANGWQAAVHPDDLETWWARLDQAANDETLEQALRLRDRTGRYSWFLCLAKAVMEDDGRPRRWFGSLADFHDLRVSEMPLQLLLGEQQHRVKNILSMVRSLADRTVRYSKTLSEFATHFEGRISALARSHSVMARRADNGADLEELIRDEMLAHGIEDGKGFTVEGPPTRLRPKPAEIIGLAIHELATNGLKYGALSVPTGRLSVTWRVENVASEPKLILKWKESRVAALLPQPARKGFGRELIEFGLPHQLGAATALEFAPDGVRCVIELPLVDSVLVTGEGP